MRIRTICVPTAVLGLSGCTADVGGPAPVNEAPFEMETTRFDDATAHSRRVGETIETILKTGDTIVAVMTVQLATGQVTLQLNAIPPVTPSLTLPAAPTLAQANELAYQLWRKSIASDVSYDDPIADGCSAGDLWCVDGQLAWTQEGCWILEEYCTYCCWTENEELHEGLKCSGTHYECDWSDWRCWGECVFGEPS